MITGFEEYTYELTEYERDVLLPVIVDIIKRTNKDNPIVNADIIRGLRQNGHKTTESRFRKIINVIRCAGIVGCVIATSKGYYVAEDRDDAMRYIKSLDERINSISQVRDVLHCQIINRFGAENSIRPPVRGELLLFP